MPSVSVCMIVRDEEENISEALLQLGNLPDEIVLVDTGSKDKTIEVATRTRSDLQVYHYEWCNDFSAARNFSLNQASKDFIFIWDADDRIDEKDLHRLNKLKETLMTDSVYYLIIDNPGIFEDGIMGRLFTQIRLFPNRKELRYRGKAHNEIESSVKPLGLKEIVTDITIHHIGYADAEVVKAKHQRTFQILLEEAKEAADDPRVNLYLGMHYLQREDPSKAIELLEKVEQSLLPENNKCWGLYMAYINLVYAYNQIGQKQQAACYWRKYVRTAVDNEKQAMEALEIAESLDLMKEIEQCLS